MPLDSEDQRQQQLPTDDNTVLSVDLRHTEDPPWSGWDVLLIAFVALFAIVIFSLGAFAIAVRLGMFHGLSPQDLARDPRIVVPVQVAAYVVVFAFMYVLVRRGYGRWFWQTVHWNWPRRGWAFLLGGVALALAIEFSSALLPIPKSLPIEHFFKDATSAYLMGVFGITAAPLIEELFFRGFMYPVVARRLGMWAGVVLTAVAFALIHQSQLGYAWAPLLLLFAVGMVLTTTRARLNSVAAGFLVHVGYNTTLFVLLYFSSDHFRHLERAM